MRNNKVGKTKMIQIWAAPSVGSAVGTCCIQGGGLATAKLRSDWLMNPKFATTNSRNMRKLTATGSTEGRYTTQRKNGAAILTRLMRTATARATSITSGSTTTAYFKVMPSAVNAFLSANIFAKLSRPLNAH